MSLLGASLRQQHLGMSLELCTLKQTVPCINIHLINLPPFVVVPTGIQFDLNGLIIRSTHAQFCEGGQQSRHVLDVEVFGPQINTLYNHVLQ